MKDTQLYQQILGLSEPWLVERVDLKMDQQRVDIFVEHRADAVFLCPVCGQARPLYDHADERVWRHLDSCQLKTYLHARVPRTCCPEHGIHKVKLPWAQTRSRFTLLMERMIIDVIRQCSTISGACGIMRVSWDEAFGVMQRAVTRGQERKEAAVVKHVGVDEKAFRKGHSYLTVVCDLQRSTVEHVAEDRTTESLAGYWSSLTPAQRDGVEAVAMDMWEPYVRATMAGLPLAAEKIVFDRFHVMKQMNEAVNRVRLGEHRKLSSWGCGLLKGTKHWWLYAAENLPDRYRAGFARVKDRNLQTARAWAIKETLRGLWAYTSTTWAGKFFARWFGWAKRSKLTPVKKVADMIKTRIDNVISYCRHPITNGVAEGINSKIMTIKRKCCGFANLENFKTAIYFHCGGLELYPQ
jgi:transposase